MVVVEVIVRAPTSAMHPTALLSWMALQSRMAFFSKFSITFRSETWHEACWCVGNGEKCCRGWVHGSLTKELQCGSVGAELSNWFFSLFQVHGVCISCRYICHASSFLYFPRRLCGSLRPATCSSWPMVPCQTSQCWWKSRYRRTTWFSFYQPSVSFTSMDCLIPRSVHSRLIVGGNLRGHMQASEARHRWPFEPAVRPRTWQAACGICACWRSTSVRSTEKRSSPCSNSHTWHVSSCVRFLCVPRQRETRATTVSRVCHARSNTGPLPGCFSSRWPSCPACTLCPYHMRIRTGRWSGEREECQDWEIWVLGGYALRMLQRMPQLSPPSLLSGAWPSAAWLSARPPSPPSRLSLAWRSSAWSACTSQAPSQPSQTSASAATSPASPA